MLNHPVCTTDAGIEQLTLSVAVISFKALIVSPLAGLSPVMPASVKSLQQMAIFVTVFTGGGCSMMYYLMQKNFARSEYYRLALERLSGHHVAMESLGAPPLKVHNIHLTDRHNRIDHHSAQVKIPVTGSKTGGYLYTFSSKKNTSNRWQLQEAVLQLKDGRRIDVLGPCTEALDHTSEDLTEVWS
ncbi:hypothetical protein GJAV_G00093210 [Gymnothorax javanicus]|nr:hypothetical protein GJAV_G00093210 [Gymnothorax javanicus]